MKLRELYELVDGVSGCEVLVDDRPLPYARELWLPLMWILLASFNVRDYLPDRPRFVEHTAFEVSE